MKILLCHNHYQQPGGEDQSFAAEAWLLQSQGHEVLRYELHNDAIHDMKSWEVARRTIWNGDSYRELRALIRQERPQIMHCTNTFPLISPAAYYAARREGVAVVQSLRNYRLLCPNAYFLREGGVCEACLNKTFAWPGVQHGCYRESRAATAVVAAMQTVHRLAGTWRRAVDLYFTPSEFTRQKYLAAGFAPERIAVKPNFVHPAPTPGSGAGGYAVFVGRLSPEKGIDALLAAWQQVGARLPLKIVGDGPLAPQVQSAAAASPGLEYLGRRTPAEVLEIVGHAACLVMPSLWYETFGRTIVEAFAKGTPALVSRLGAMAELVDPGRTGLHLEPGDPLDLAAKVDLFLQMPDPLRRAMRVAARQEFEQRYTATANYDMLLALYRKALALRARSGGSTASATGERAAALTHGAPPPAAPRPMPHALNREP